VPLVGLDELCRDGTGNIKSVVLACQSALCLLRLLRVVTGQGVYRVRGWMAAMYNECKNDPAGMA